MNAFLQTGDGIEVYFNFTNNLNIEFSWETYAYGCWYNLDYDNYGSEYDADTISPQSGVNQLPFYFEAETDYEDVGDCYFTVYLDVWRDYSSLYLTSSVGL